MVHFHPVWVAHFHPVHYAHINPVLVVHYHRFLQYTEDLENNNINKHTHRIKSAVSNLTTILNDFLHLEKVEEGKVELALSTFNLTVFSQEIVEEMQLLTKSKQKINYSHTEHNPEVTMDINLLKNCIINLISNAIKYSGEETTIQLSTNIDIDTIGITVRDNGIGIPQEDQKHLFEAFFRAQNTGNIPGTGLGLNIVSRYVILMRGTIEFESKANEGTTFTIKFPI